MAPSSRQPQAACTRARLKRAQQQQQQQRQWRRGGRVVVGVVSAASRRGGGGARNTGAHGARGGQPYAQKTPHAPLLKLVLRDNTGPS